jgi:KipI family sensor histidine kinase inhibitor
MSLQAMGDTAYLITLAGTPDAAMLARVRALAADLAADRLAGVVEIVPAYASIGVSYEPERVPTPRGDLPWRVVAEWLERHLAGDGPTAARKVRAARTHVVPVCYGGEHGPDLEAVAKAAKLSAAEVVKLHAGADYLVAAIGFTPGFPYLSGLPPALATPRRATPRLRVPAGSVGIGGAQTGIYPRETPGGWQLIGRTVLELFNPGLDAPARLAAGDEVKFKAVDKLPEAAAPGAVAKARAGGSREPGLGRFCEVVKPGALTTVQDLGRRGFASAGLAAGGALDPWAAAVANLAVGNPPGAAVLECTYVGPVLRFPQAATVALAGAEVEGLAAGRPIRLEAGAILDCSALARGARLYVAFAGGGVRAPLVLGGAGTVVGAGFGGLGGCALEAGDRVPLSAERVGEVPGGAGWRLAAPVPPPGRRTVVEVRMTPGPDWARIFRRHGPEGATRAVEARRFRLSAKSDRMGLRLQGEAFTLPSGAGGDVSRPVVPGTVQLPPDGQPIVLMAEGQTIGGYAQLGQVVSIDLPLLAQARPGAEIVFRMTDVSAAQQARLRVAADLARLRVGLGLLR